ncbi:HotDog domain-containing protein [Aspergillus unguis]
MIGIRQVVHPRLRFAASLFHQKTRTLPHASRHVSTVSSSHQQSHRRSIWLRRSIYFGIFSLLGAAAASKAISITTGPLEVPGSEADEDQLRQIHYVYNGLGLVRKLRGDPDYIEAPVYGNWSSEDKKQRLTSGPLSGSGGLALQKVFWNAKEKSAINVVYLGRGMEGWPITVHGGAIATILDEHLARVAIQHLPERTAVTANLDINYRRPVFSGTYYSVHATLDQERSTDRKAYVKGEVRSMDGDLLAESSGLFVVPRGYKLRKLGDAY